MSSEHTPILFLFSAYIKGAISSDKDCIEDLRVFLTQDSQAVLEQAVSAKARSAELIYVSIDVEPTQFNTGHFTVDITYYYRILVDATVNGSRPYTLCGLAVFSKRVILCGGESEAKIFTSKTVIDGADTHQMMRCSNPEAVVEVVDPMVLASRVVDMCNCNCNCCENTVINLPSAICACFDGELVLCGESRRLYVTIGQFSIIRMERDTQLRIPNLGYCIPTKQCAGVGGVSEQAPCDVFESIDFPVGSFFPPCGEGECGSIGGVSSSGCGCGTVGGVSTGTNNCKNCCNNNSCCNNNCCGNNCCNNNCCNNNCCNTCGSNCCGTVGGVSTGTTASSCGSCSTGCGTTGCGTTGTVAGVSTGTTTVGCGSCSLTCGSTGTVGGVSTGTTTVGCGSCKTCK